MNICGDFHDSQSLFRYVNKQTKIGQIFKGPKPSQEKKIWTSFWCKMLQINSLKSRDQFIPKKRVNFIVYFCFEEMLKFEKNLEPRKAWSAMFFSIFYHHGIQQNQQQHCRSVFWKEFIYCYEHHCTCCVLVAWWLQHWILDQMSGVRFL